MGCSHSVVDPTASARLLVRFFLHVVEGGVAVGIVVAFFVLRSWGLVSVVSSSGSLSGSWKSSAILLTLAACAFAGRFLDLLFVSFIVLPHHPSECFVWSFFLISSVTVHVLEAWKRYGVTVEPKSLGLSLRGLCMLCCLRTIDAVVDLDLDFAF